MKLYSTILSIVLLVLSCLPCADAKQEVSVGSNGKIATEQHSGHSKKEHNDLCSPFCICNCCGAQILSFTPTNFFDLNPLPAEPIVKPETSYKSNLASQFCGGIWQPPQLS